MTDILPLLWQSRDHCLYAIFLLRGMFNRNDLILDGQLLFSLHRKICPEVNIFSFYRLTGHKTNSGEGFLHGKNQFRSGKGHCYYGWTA